MSVRERECQFQTTDCVNVVKGFNSVSPGECVCVWQGEAVGEAPS